MASVYSTQPKPLLSGSGFDTGIRARAGSAAKPTPLVVENPDRATMYVCGVTVYDHCHLGHARSACAFDLIARHISTKVGKLLVARNVTDVDDKIINRARERGLDWRELAQNMEASMRSDFSALGCLPPAFEPRATEHIPEMIDHIGALLRMGLAYVDPEGSVWRDGSTWNGVGRVSGRKIDDLWNASRVAPHPGKRGPNDFVLWKAAKPGEPFWNSPWGAGRPGWHIECSAMSRKTLGDTLDIHGGGEDLKFPHHECECAQSEPVTGKPLARQWLHNGFVVLPKADGGHEEMHKSSGNALNIKGLLASHPSEAIRLWALSAHYRQPLPYSDSSIEQARARAWRWAQAREGASIIGNPDSPPDEQVSSALDADFNAPMAFARIDALAKAAKASPRDRETANHLLGSLRHLGMGFCASADLAPDSRQTKSDANHADTQAAHPELERLVKERDKARIAKDWGQADSIRDQIKALGFEISDAPSQAKKPKT